MIDLGLTILVWLLVVILFPLAIVTFFATLQVLTGK
jgi:hypothetical protein